MRTITNIIAMTLAAIGAIPAAAQDRIVDTGDIKAVSELLREGGYKAVIKTNKQGENYIVSGANGNEFQVVFYGCKNGTGCDSYEFYSWYKKEPLFTLDLVNEWNAKKRFLKIVIDSDGDLGEYLYVSAVGKTTYANFIDGVEWYTAMDGSLAAFLKEKRDAAAKTK